METLVHKPLTMTRMRAGVIYQLPDAASKLLRAGSSALEAMTDLRLVPAATIAATATLVQANQAMIARGVRLLLVVDTERRIEGLITARDTMGEKPINLLHDRGGKHGELKVADLMTPREDIEVLDMAAVRRAEVGDIVATLKEVGRQHALVLDRDPDTGEEYVRGIFSVTQIGRQLGLSIPIFEVAHTFAEIEARLAR